MGGTLDDLRKLVEATPCHSEPPSPPTAENVLNESPQLVLICLHDVTPEAVSWLWPQRIAKGKLTLVIGDPGLGKSFATLDMAARISTGCDWPDGTQSTRGSVILLSA